MKQAVRGLVLLGLIAGLLAPYADLTHAQSGVVVRVLCSQYIRQEPLEDSPRLGLMNPNEVHPAVGRWGDWVLVQISATLQGWAFNGECIALQGDFQSLPLVDYTQTQTVSQSSPPTLQIACAQYVRTQPDPDAANVAIIYPTDPPWRILGRNADRSWLWVTNFDGGFVGWTALTTECISVLGNFYAIPEVSAVATTPGYSGAPLLEVVCAQYVRALPATDALDVAIMYPTDPPWRILGRNEDGSWLWVTNANGSFTGWTSNSDCVTVRGDYSLIPPVSPSSTVPTYSGPPVATVLCDQYLRAYPSSDGRRLTAMTPATGALIVTGRLADGSWLFVSLPNGSEGWTSNGGCVEVQGDLTQVPVVAPQLPAGPVTLGVLCEQYVRVQSNPEAANVAIMYPADLPWTVVGRSQDGGWWLVINADGGFTGWTASGTDCITLHGDPASVPVVASADLTYTGPAVAVIACTQYLRAFPSPEGRTLDILQPGTGPYSVSGRSADSAWLLLMEPNGTQGWAAWGDCLSVLGDTRAIPILSSPLAYDGPPTATITCTQYLRALPDVESAPLLILDGTQGTLLITGRTPDQDWMRITLPDGTGGWAATGACLNVRGNFYDAPVITLVTPGYSGPAIATIACAQYLRTLPDEASEAIAILQPGDGVLSVLGRNENTSWLYVQRADGLQGWAAYGACLRTQGNLLALPLQEVPEYAGPPVLDVICDINLRRNPIADAEIMTLLTPDTGFLNIVGRDDGSDWALVEHPSGLVGWLSLSACTSVQGNIVSAPTPGTIARDPELWTVIRAAGGACDGSDQASQIIQAYNRSGPSGPVSRQCAGDQEAVLALTRFQVEVAIVSGTCPGFQRVPLSGGQTLCHRALRTTQVDDFMAYAGDQ